MLDVRDVAKRYPAVGGEPVVAVDGVSLAIAPGEVVALYGPSGSGKTTLLKLIAAVMRPDRGQVLVDGRDVSALGERDAADYRLRELGLILQSFHMIAGLAAVENASLKLIAAGHSRKDAARRVTPLLDRLGLAERAEQRASALSMGERQRLAIAKALSTDPRLVLADEPTGNLDTRRGRDVLGFLAEVGRERGAAVLIVTHDPEAAKFADRVHTLRDGRLGGRDRELSPHAAGGSVSAT